MAFDGVTMAAVVKQLKDTITDARISKIAQPEDNEILMTIHTQEGNVRLLMSADASLPLVYLTENNKQGPLTAPNFCMLLRKHIQGGRIVSVTQPGLERIIKLEIEHLDEMGDLCRKFLIFELMGKHSNIIFVNGDGIVIDSIKRVSAAVSSVREVLPGREYFIPQTQQKADILDTDSIDLDNLAQAQPLFKAIYGGFTGISPVLAQELCFRADVDSDRPIETLDATQCCKITAILKDFSKQINSGEFEPCMVYEGKKPKEFAGPFPMKLHSRV